MCYKMCEGGGYACGGNALGANYGDVGRGGAGSGCARVCESSRLTFVQLQDGGR